jgi:hypothetical protein
MQRLLMILLPLCMLACSDGASVQSGTILPQDVMLSPGDVVFRRGSGFTSQAVLMAEHGGAYSHVGIVVDSAGVPMVVHAVPYEDDEDRVKMEQPCDFFASSRAQKGAVYRHCDSTIACQAAEAAVAVYHHGVPFDHSYDDSDTMAMYCTELVVFAYGKTARPLPAIASHHLHLVGFESDCILPSDLLECQDLRQVTTF